MKAATRKIAVALLSLTVIATGTYFAIRWANGYRPSSQGLQGTGLLAANSFPPGAQVFIDGKLTTATDDTLNLSPGKYQIEIKRDGLIPWSKLLTIEEELVTQTNATLFPSVPTLTPVTFTGASNLNPSPDGTKMAYVVSDASTRAENGLYVYDLTNGTLSFRGRERQITRSTPTYDLEEAEIVWSPDSSQLLISFEDEANLLIDESKFNDLDSVSDVTARLSLIFSSWEHELKQQELQKLIELPEFMKQVATESAKNIYFSPDEKKMVYTATAEVTIPEELIPPLPASSTQEEERTIQPGSIYVYDLKEDRNFKIDEESLPPAELGEEVVDKVMLTNEILAQGLLESTPEASPSANLLLQEDRTVGETIAAFKLQYSPLYLNSYQWFPTSSHLLVSKPEGVQVLEYDTTNRATVYSGPRDEQFVYAWPNGSKLLILTSLGSDEDMPLNLYAIGLK